MNELGRWIEKRPRAVGAALFLVAVVARLALVLTSRFTGDEMAFWDQAHKIAQGKEFPLLGPDMSSSPAHHPGPLLYVVIAIPLLLNSAPECANVFVAALGAVSVLLFWDSLRHWFGEKGALLAGLMMACSPWSTLYADRIWNPNVVGFFVALAFWASCRLRRAPTLGGVIVLVVSQAAMPQLHMSSPMVWLALVPLWLPSVRRWRWSWPLVALAIAATLYVPMLVHELRTDWQNTKAFLAEASAHTSPDWKRVPLWAFRLLTLDVSYHQLHSYWGTHTEDEMFAFIWNGNGDFRYGPVRYCLLGLSVLLAAFTLGLATARTASSFARAVRLRLRGAAWSWAWCTRRPFFWAGLVGLVANVALMRVTRKEVFGHYVQPLLPLYFAAFAELGAWARKGLRAELVWTASLIVCIGGIDAAVWVSRTLDARNGLLTMRRVIAAVEHDQPDATSVGLAVDYPGGTRPYVIQGCNLLLGLDPGRRLRFSYGNQYLLTLYTAPRPRGGSAIMSSGPVVLYKLR